MSDLTVLRARERREMPWKNGAGITREVIVQPAGADFDSFDWRISIASITNSGPFSQFPGIDRRLVVLEGQLTLRIDGEAGIELSAASPPVLLAGELAIQAEPTLAPVADLNVMTRRGRYRSSLQAQTLGAPVTIHNGASCTVLISTELIDIEYEGMEHRLQPRDAVLLRGTGAARLAPRAAPAIFYLIEITETDVGSSA
ncbi:MAG TPA: HutD family protein [Steroidobacteraceae bacterium]|nr:HutD family protein [Steroidobacteraceae bacterium]